PYQAREHVVAGTQETNAGKSAVLRMCVKDPFNMFRSFVGHRQVVIQFDGLSIVRDLQTHVVGSIPGFRKGLDCRKLQKYIRSACHGIYEPQKLWLHFGIKYVKVIEKNKNIMSALKRG